jgi:serine/threonine protein phosphatase PrpC
MRKQNADFQTAFISREGARLRNNDYFAYASLEDIACYVIADGIETGDETESGRLAVEAVMAAFHANPSMSGGGLRRYIGAAQRALRDNQGNLSARASVAVAVTDYTSLRYGHAGNVRLSLFRSGDLIRASKDHSLSQALADKNEIPADKIAKHEGRGNLSRYLGQKGRLAPQISGKIPLRDGDILALLTRGVWESCDQYDFRSALSDAGNDPQKACDLTERLVLSSHPEELDNYTLAVVFINKVYVDPKKGERLKLFLKIAVPILILALIAGAAFYFLRQKRRADIRHMETYYISGIEYIQDNNFARAGTDMESALTLAMGLDDGKWQNDIAAVQRLLETLAGGDAALGEADYVGAQEYYLRARERSAFTDGLAAGYIERKLGQVSDYLSVYDMLALGDSLAERGNYPLAEERYLAARDLSARAYYSDGKQRAMDALSALYEKMSQAAATDEDAARAQVAEEIKAADFIAQGDKAFQDGDLISAEMYYTMASEKHTELGNEQALETIAAKLELVGRRRLENQDRMAAAAEYESAGAAYMDEGLHADAKKQLILARDIYAELRDTVRLEEIRRKIEAVDEFLVE